MIDDKKIDELMQILNDLWYELCAFRWIVLCFFTLELFAFWLTIYLLINWY